MNKNCEQIQIRIDSKTKNDAKKILEGLGLDMSSAVKIFLRQVINTKNFPCEIRDENGFTLQSAEALRKSISEGAVSRKSFKNGSELIKDALKD
ncbi:MAG: type II toxin-antitoxin system RelB/DinJ family antitoxin [Candidatus Pacebacteria bacterium]|nr:type II toxin-antitoxin system RelB/DinJ family antitoxin [Candidatus Paceibacterota bacterium]